MRLIDADKLKDEVASMWGDSNHITESIYEIIDNIPTIETQTIRLSAHKGITNTKLKKGT